MKALRGKVLLLGRAIPVLALLGFGHCGAAPAEDPVTVDALLAESAKYLTSEPTKAQQPLERLRTLQPSFNAVQNDKYQRYLASSLGYQGRHEERVALVESIVQKPQSPANRARLLYELIDGNAALGRFESALQAMNESILLLPDLQHTTEKIAVLQGALALLHSFRAYDEALEFADRIHDLGITQNNAYAKCVGLTDKVELNFIRGNSTAALALVPDAIRDCDADKNLFFSLIVRTNVAIHLIDSGQYARGLEASLPLMQQFTVMADSSDFLTGLQEAVARAYLKLGNTQRAHHYGLLAYQRAQAGKVLQLQQETSETMATIQRAQNQLASAINYYDINLTLKKKALNEQQQKNLAYQRVRFETRDKANQMALLEQQSKTLSIEKELQQRRYQNLVLLLTLGAVVLTILGAWLIKTLRQKNLFRITAEVDGLTQVSNRTHFTACAKNCFAQAKTPVSLVLFDMDWFKRINDTYGHATGDWVLKTVCHTVKAQLRKGDLIGRLGGEEFAICAVQSVGQTEDDVRALAEACRAAIAAIDSGPSGFDFALTASFGIATRNSPTPHTYEETLVAADKTLYRSKNAGRNRVSVYQPAQDPQTQE
ncbi:MAG: hypothetical protein CFE43_07735 [Burkholderiales bacterium PBB3]|nr:MAG: hypothetical protein CFE43_07735 [Burkholderiales bacterium PBB3]